MRGSLVLFALSLVVVLVHAADLAAEPSPIQGGDGDAVPIAIGFEWTLAPGAESCTSGEALKRAAEAQLQRQAFVPPDEAQVLVRGRVVPTDDLHGFEAQLFLVAGDGSVLGQRVLRSDRPDCASLDQPLALVIAVAVDTLRAQPKSSLRIVSRRSWHAELAPFAVFEWGLLPNLGAGVGLDVALAPPSHWLLDVTFAGWPVSNRAAVPAGRGADFTAYLGGFFLCPPLGRNADVKVRACLGVEAGRVVGTGVAFDISRPRSGWVVGPEARLGVVWPLGRRVAFETRIGVTVPVVRDAFTYTDEFRQEQPVYRPAPVLLMLDFGLPLRIP